jgi:Holliday junction DNA helicase RuvB
MNDFFIADEERVIAPEFIRDDNDIETSLRPHALDEYVGQEKVKENLKIYIEAAKKSTSHLTTFYSTDLPVSVKRLSRV